jgi:hypothetical protein
MRCLELEALRKPGKWLLGTNGILGVSDVARECVGGVIVEAASSLVIAPRSARVRVAS